MRAFVCRARFAGRGFGARKQMYARRIWRRLRGHSRDDHVPACGCSVATPGKRPACGSPDRRVRLACAARHASAHCLRTWSSPYRRSVCRLAWPAPVLRRVPGPQAPLRRGAGHSSAAFPVLRRRSAAAAPPWGRPLLRPGDLATYPAGGRCLGDRVPAIVGGRVAVQGAIGQVGQISRGWMLGQLDPRGLVQTSAGWVTGQLRPIPYPLGGYPCRLAPDGVVTTQVTGIRPIRRPGREAPGAPGRPPAQGSSRGSATRRSVEGSAGRVAGGSAREGSAGAGCRREGPAGRALSGRPGSPTSRRRSGTARRGRRSAA